MGHKLRLGVLLAAAFGLLLLALGVVYLTVECQALPGLLGPTHGDTSPRTKLGIVGVALAAAVFLAVLLAVRRRPPAPPRQR